MFTRDKTPPPARDWYWTASEEDRREYDAFGPWIQTVRSEAEMPRRFRAFHAAHRDARILIKVPIRADRQDVRPGMDLYRMVLAVHDERLVVHRRVGDGVETREVGWDEIAAVQSFSDLLDGRWALLLRDGEAISIGYNAVSTDRLDEIGTFIRTKLVTEAHPRTAHADGAAVTVADLFYANMMRVVGNAVAHPVLPLHFEPRDRLCRNAAGRHGLSNGLLVLDCGAELVIVDRGAPARPWYQPNYAVRYTFMPFERLSAFALHPPPPGKGRRFSRLVLRIGCQDIGIPCLTPPDRVVDCLAARGVPRQPA